MYIDSTRNPFLLKRKKLDAKYLKTCIKFVIFYSLPKKLCSIRSLSKQLTKKSENLEPSWRTKTWRASFFKAAVLHGSIKQYKEQGELSVS